MQGHTASWWQGLEEKPVGLTHSSPGIPVIISLLLLSYSLHCFKSDLLLPSCCSWLWCCNFWCSLMERKRLFSFFLTFFAISFTVDSSEMLIFSLFFGADCRSLSLMHRYSGCSQENDFFAWHYKGPSPAPWLSFPVTAVLSSKTTRLHFCSFAA